MKAVEVPRNKSNEEKLRIDEMSQLRSISEQISYEASELRPDIIFESCKIVNCGKNPYINYLKQANETL